MSWSGLIYFNNPHISFCYTKTCGSIKTILSFPYLILFIQLQCMETSTIQFLLQSWSPARLTCEREPAYYTGRGEGGEYFLACVAKAWAIHVLKCVCNATCAEKEPHCSMSKFSHLFSHQVLQWHHTSMKSERLLLTVLHCTWMMSRFATSAAFCWITNNPTAAVSHLTLTSVINWLLLMKPLIF